MKTFSPVLCTRFERFTSKNNDIIIYVSSANSGYSLVNMSFNFGYPHKKRIQ